MDPAVVLDNLSYCRSVKHRKDSTLRLSLHHGAEMGLVLLSGSQRVYARASAVVADAGLRAHGQHTHQLLDTDTARGCYTLMIVDQRSAHCELN